MFAGAFSDKALREMGQVMDSHASRLNLKLAKDVLKDSQGRLDMTKYYGYTTLDIMGELALGDSFHSLDPDSEHEWVRGFSLGTKFGSIRTSLSRYYPLDFIFAWVFLRLTSKIRQKNLKTGRDMITRRLDIGKLGPGKCDLLDPVIGSVNDNPKNGVTRNEVDVNVISMLLAGCPLSTVVIAAATYFLLRYPETLSQLTHEIRTKFNSEQEIFVASVNDMPYLEAVITETLRIHHPTPSDPKPRAVGPEGQLVDGHWIPGRVSSLFLVGLFLLIIFTRRPSLESKCKQPITPPPISCTRSSFTPSDGFPRQIHAMIPAS
jgi:cytochrome P450